jgi:hypothetical protein
MWNIAHNLGGFLAPIIVGGCAKAFGWRWGMWVPGAIGLSVALFVLGAVRDRPTDLGYKPVDGGAAPAKKAAPAKDAPPAAAAEAAPAAAAAADAKPADAKPAAAAASAAPADGEAGGMMGALRSVLKLPAIWALAFTYFFVYVVRQGVTSWMVFYLMAEKGAADAGAAALTVSGAWGRGQEGAEGLGQGLGASRACPHLCPFAPLHPTTSFTPTPTRCPTTHPHPPPGLELGGLAGSMVAGRLSDMALRRAAERGEPGGAVGQRIRVVMLYTAGMAAMLLALQAVPAGATALQWLVIAGLGFTIYGPQMLIGLSGAELVAPAAVGASQGILGWIGARGGVGEGARGVEGGAWQWGLCALRAAGSSGPRCCLHRPLLTPSCPPPAVLPCLPLVPLPRPTAYLGEWYGKGAGGASAGVRLVCIQPRARLPAPGARPTDTRPSPTPHPTQAPPTRACPCHTSSRAPAGAASSRRCSAPAPWRCCCCRRSPTRRATSSASRAARAAQAEPAARPSPRSRERRESGRSAWPAPPPPAGRPPMSRRAARQRRQTPLRPERDAPGSCY